VHCVTADFPTSRPESGPGTNLYAAELVWVQSDEDATVRFREATGQFRQATASTSTVGRPIVARFVITTVWVLFVSDLEKRRTR
jgi:hypothetical protein